MSAATNQIKVSNFELFKRILYSFQVLVVGIAIPALFILGISSNFQKKTPDTEMVKPINSVDLTVSPTVTLPAEKI